MKDPEKKKEKLSAYYRCYFCDICGFVEIPEEITHKPITAFSACPDCGEQTAFGKRVGRFVYEDGREWSWKRLWFKKIFFLSKFKPGLDRKDQNRKKKKK